MATVPPEDFGLKTAKSTKDARSKNRLDLGFDSAVATYMAARVKVVRVGSNFFSYPHGLGYIPKVLVFHILSTYSRKLPYDDGGGVRDFSITASAVNIRGGTSGDVYKIYVFAQPIL
jgi:hypothetical protein